MKINSLFTLLCEYEVCIPTIQREYVQGSDKEEIRQLRKKLLEDIVLTLEANDKRLKLNIIYGITDEKGEKKIFYPLDGQQRLTTLFLLHWYLSIKSEQEMDVNDFSFETRYAANSFFKLLVNREKIIEYREICKAKNKEEFTKSIMSKSWFKSQWFNDITILAALNVIGEFIDLKISDDKSINYYNKLKDNNCPIYFDFLTEVQKDIDVYKKSAVNYLRLNSRGKQLDKFENVKAKLEIIQRKLDEERRELFTWNYDRAYIDLFYGRLSKEKALEEKTKRINDETINVLINIYNLLVVIKKPANLVQCNNRDKYYEVLFNTSKSIFNDREDESIKIEKTFWQEYFEHLDIIMSTIQKENNMQLYIDKIFKEDNQYIIYNMSRNNSNETLFCDNNKTVVYLRYIYYYYKNHRKYVNEREIKQLEYITENLKYTSWKYKEFKYIEIFIEKISSFDDILMYFNEHNYKTIMNDLQLEEYKYGINDLKVRIQEQSIKAKILNKIERHVTEFEGINVDYQFFDCLEKKSDKRQIWYLLFISGMWDNEVTIEKIKELLQYMEVAKEFYCNNSKMLLWRKLFAIATYSCQNEDKLLDCDVINGNVNNRYVRYINEKKYNFIENHNLHYWIDEYYFISDDMVINDDKYKLSEIKLNTIKRAYKIWRKNKLSNEKVELEWLKYQFDKSYDNCWLKYAIDRNYNELFIDTISYDLNLKTVYIDAKFQNIYSLEKCNFFARVYLLDKDKEGWYINQYSSKVWDYSSKRVSSEISENGIEYKLANKIINHYGLRILWNDYFEKNLLEESEEKKLSRRYFFYYNHYIEIVETKNSLVSIMNGKVAIIEFAKGNSFRLYEYILKDSPIEREIILKVNDFKNETKNYRDVHEVLCEKWEENSYYYNDQYIRKCGFKGKNYKIEKQEFSVIGQEQSLEFKKL